MMKHQQVGMLVLVFDPDEEISKLFFFTKKAGPNSSVHHWDPHKIRIHTLTSPLTQPYSPNIVPSDFHHLSFERRLARTKLHGRGTTEHRAAMESKFYLSVIYGLVLGLKKASQRRKVYWKITIPSAMLVAQFLKFSHV